MKNKKIFLGLTIISTVLIMIFFSFSVSAQAVKTNYNVALGNASPLDVAVNIINWGLGLLALFAVIIILWGGFIWLFSQGEEEKIEKAKKILRNGIIGLLIILASWGIAYYLINRLFEITNPPSGGPGNSTGHYANGNPFMIDHTNPADEANNVTLCHLVAVTFTLPVDHNSINENTFFVYIAGSDKKGNGGDCSANTDCKSSSCESSKCVGDYMAGTYAFSEEPSYSAVWYPTLDYQPATTYRVELTTAVTGLDEVTTDTYQLDASDPKRIFDFTTGTDTDIIPPKVDVINVAPFPGDEDQNVCRKTPIQASFTESLDPASVKDENVWLFNYDEDTTIRDGSDELSSIRFTSIGGQADDTFITSPNAALSENTYYGLSLYSGTYDAAIESVRANYLGAIRDTCGNPLSGDYDDDMEGSPTDDFVDSTSAALNYDYCYCSSTAGFCHVDIGADSCSIDASNTCTLDSTCAADDTRDDYVGFDFPWTFKTGELMECVPNITAISYNVPDYYSEDKITYNEEKESRMAGSEDTDKVVIQGQYLYPFYDVEFFNNISAAGMNCFDRNHNAANSCFVSNNGSAEIIMRTPVGTQTSGFVRVENEYGLDASADMLYVYAPYISSLSPATGTDGQFVTIHGKNFIDYDPTNPSSQKGKVYFDGHEVETPCADGWDNTQIIVKIPDNFSTTYGITADDFLEVQVITVGPNGIWNDGQWNTGDAGTENYDDKYSNKKGFTFTSGTPGPGICALDPDCSDTGNDDVAIIGQNFGSAQGEAYFADFSNSYTAALKQWNVDYSGGLSVYSGYKDVLTNQMPVKTQNAYEVAVGVDGPGDEKLYSNGLNYDVPCQEPPSLFMYNSCDLENTFYLPNPRPYEEAACVNSEVMLAFTQNMDNTAVTSGVKIYNCGSGDYNADNCTTVVAGTYSSEMMNNAYFGGDGSGTTDYEEFDFMPTTRLTQNTWYKVVVPLTVTNVNGVAIDQAYDWHFKVRDSSEDCAVNVVDLRPSYLKESAYDYANACIGGYNYNGVDYTYKAKPYNSDCFALRNDFDWHWNINNSTSPNIIKFRDGSAAQNSSNGYNTVCMQGNGSENYGLAYVDAGPTDPSGLYDSSWVNDEATFDVDYGYCTSDANCQSGPCQHSTCDLTTSHCTPEITGFTPATVGPGGCASINGCYFGPTRGSNGKVQFGNTEANYLSTALCGNDTWKDNQVIVELPTGVTPNNYTINLTSYNNLTTSSSTQIATQADATPCLCRADPYIGREGTEVTLYGKFYNIFTSGTRYAQFYQNKNTAGTSWNTLDVATYGSDAWDMVANVPTGATTSEANGVKLIDDNDHESNSLNFYVNCQYNSDCSTHCCSNGFCQLEDVCNACVDSTDCQYGSCLSPCTDGVCTPYITGISPSYGNVGQPVTIQGCHFGSYYSADLYNPYSRATFGNVEADLACDVSDSWNNEEIKVVAPSGLFDAGDSAVVSARQVYLSGAEIKSQDSIVGQAYCLDAACTNQTDCEKSEIDGGCASSWQATTFTKSNVCDQVDIPVLCRVNPGNGYYSDTVNLEGNNFYQAAPESFCNCQGTKGDACRIDVGSSNCTINHTFACYTDPNNTTTACGTTINSNNGYNYYITDGCSIAIYTNEPDCVSNGGTWGTVNKCRCVNADDTSEYCYIDTGSTNCTYTNSYACNVDDGDLSATCSATSSSYMTLNGDVKYNINQETEWSFDPSAAYDHSPYEAYLETKVPNNAETGNVYVQAVEANGTVCESNGVNFDVTCTTCADCPSGMMCDLSAGSGSYGVCTSNPSGFCAAYPDSCCGNTGCKTTLRDDGTTDGGTCVERPLLEEDNCSPLNNATSVCTNAQITLSFDKTVTTAEALLDNSEADYSQYIKLLTAADYTNNIDNSQLSSVTKTSFGDLLLTESGLLNASTTYYIVITSNKADNTGIVDATSGMALGCSSDQETAGICTSDSNTVVLRFTTSSNAGGCPPDYVDLSADEDFTSTNYTFISKNEEQEFSASVYFNGDDGVKGNSDDQAIIGLDGVYNWSYEWSPIYNSLEDLEASNCPTVGIISKSDYGTCSCNVGQCDKTAAEESCTVVSGGTNCEISTGELCYLNINKPDNASDDETCADSAGCTCTMPEESCTIAFGDASCDTENRGTLNTDATSGKCDSTDTNFTSSANVDDTCSINYNPDNLASSCTTANNDTCYVNPADTNNTCDPTDSSYAEAGFLENQNSQTYTAGDQEGEGWASVSIVGDGTKDDNWLGNKDDSQYVRVLFCASADYLSSYSDANNQNFYFAYCRGDKADDLLPELEAPTIKMGSTIGEDFLYEYLFTNSDNEDLIGLVIYPNDINNDTNSLYDVLQPGIWGTLRLQNFGNYSESTLDDYQAVEDSYNVVTAATNYDSGSSKLYPNIYVLSFSKNAESTTRKLLNEIKSSWSFNTNGEFAPQAGSISGIENPGCQVKKEKVIKDTKRISDLGTFNYLLAKYKYLDTDGNGVEDYPTVYEGSYIQYFTNSKWPSWDSVLGNALGQSLYTDPINEFADVANNCSYDTANNKYYDESGTCWDPINKNFFGPPDSHVYQYVYNDPNNYTLYANLEFTDNSWSWANTTSYDPCRDVNYSTGCETFNYKTSSADFVGPFYHGACASNVCDSNSGFYSGAYCESDSDCQIVK